MGKWLKQGLDEREADTYSSNALSWRGVGGGFVGGGCWRNDDSGVEVGLRSQSLFEFGRITIGQLFLQAADTFSSLGKTVLENSDSSSRAPALGGKKTVSANWAEVSDFEGSGEGPRLTSVIPVASFAGFGAVTPGLV